MLSERNEAAGRSTQKVLVVENVAQCLQGLFLIPRRWVSDKLNTGRLRANWKHGYIVGVADSGIWRYGHEENVLIWIKRVKKVSQIYGTSDGVTLLAASSRLVKSVVGDTRCRVERHWNSGSVSEMNSSRCSSGRCHSTRRCKRSRQEKWMPSKELFDQYAIDNIALMHLLDFPTNVINLLIGGILHSSLWAVALSVKAETLDEFLQTETGMWGCFRQKTIGIIRDTEDERVSKL